MSYFDFINQNSPYKQHRLPEKTTTSTLLPVSIADELYESQTFNNTPGDPQLSSLYANSKNRPPTTNSSPQPVISSSSLTPQDSSNDTPSRQHPATSTGTGTGISTSVFGFINESIKQDDIQAADDLVFATEQPTSPNRKPSEPSSPLHHYELDQRRSPRSKQKEIDVISSSQLVSSPNRKTVEMQRLFEESNWKRIKAGKQHQQQLIQQLYEQRKATISEIQNNQALLQSKSEDEQRAKDNEDYDTLDKLIRQRQLVKANIDRLKYDVLEATTQQLHTAWMKMSSLTRTEGECASKVAQTYREAKNERQQQFTQYNVDMKRKHDGLLEKIKADRSGIESAKSEVAFDLDFWKQAKTELDEKMAEAVQEKTREKNELMAQVVSTDEEINRVKKKLEDLTQKRQNYAVEINNLELVIGQELLRYQPEMDAQENEEQEINSRKTTLEKQSNDLDQRDAALQQKMEQCRQYEDQGWKELNELDDTIRKAMEESQTNASTSDTMTTILNQCIFDRDRAIKELGEKQKKAHDDIKQLQSQIEQQQCEYNTVQQQIDDDDTRLNFSKMQKMKMERQKSRAVEQEQYQQAAKWQERIKQIDMTLDDDTKALAANQTKLGALDADVSISREQLHGLLVKNGAQERESVKATITLLDDSENALDQFKGTCWIVENEIDSIRNWKSYYEQYLTML